MQASGCPWA